MVMARLYFSIFLLSTFISISLQAEDSQRKSVSEAFQEVSDTVATIDMRLRSIEVKMEKKRGRRLKAARARRQAQQDTDVISDMPKHLVQEKIIDESRRLLDSGDATSSKTGKALQSLALKIQNGSSKKEEVAQAFGDVIAALAETPEVLQIAEEEKRSPQYVASMDFTRRFMSEDRRSDILRYPEDRIEVRYRLADRVVARIKVKIASHELGAAFANLRRGSHRATAQNQKNSGLQ